jgi:NADH-quinone oxidoreductase subunit E
VTLAPDVGPPADLPASSPSADPLAQLLRESDGQRSDLVQVLQRAQETLGYLSPDALCRIARRLRLSESEVFGVASFYAQFRFTPPGRHRLRVCLGTACHVKGGVQMLETVERRLGAGAGEMTADGEYDVERVACLGCCALAPVVTLDDAVYGQMSVLRLQEVLEAEAGREGRSGEGDEG